MNDDMTLGGFLRLDDDVQEVAYVASKKLIGNDNKPVVWKIRPLRPEENDELVKKCTKNVPVPGKRNAFTPEVDYSLYARRLSIACTVYPRLNDPALQDAMGVMGEDALFCRLLPLLGEQSDYAAKVREVNGFDEDFNDLVEEAKN